MTAPPALRAALHAAAVLAPALLAGCHGPAPGPEPVLELAPRGCDPVPNLALAARLTSFPTAWSASAHVLADSACLAAGGAPASTYTVFSLPERTTPATLHVESRITGRTLLAPRLMLFDGAGQPTRGIGFESFAFRGSGLAAIIRLDPREAYVVVASAPDRVGGTAQRLASRTDPIIVPFGVGVVAIPHGSERAHEAVFAHNGEVAVEVRLAAEQRVP